MKNYSNHKCKMYKEKQTFAQRENTIAQLTEFRSQLHNEKNRLTQIDKKGTLFMELDYLTQFSLKKIISP